MEESTKSLNHRINEENENYNEHRLTIQNSKNRKADEMNFKGKQYIECFLQLDITDKRISLRPTREDIANLF